MSTWILLRGLTREARHWGDFPVLLRDAVSAGRILLPDLPGNGTRVHARAPDTVPQMVDALRRALADEGVDGPYRVVAMSLGGMVATAWAERYPQDIERLVLINTSMRPFSGALQRLRPSAWRALLRAAAHWRDAPAAEAAIHAITCNRRTTRAADLDAWTAIRASAPVSRANALRQLGAAARFRAGRTAPQCATLILSSAGDRLVNPCCSASIAAAWHAPHLQHPWAGHDLPHDDPRWASDMIGLWLAEAAAADDAP
jgi:pimeloyl-ACP methyl ester carboxylesterase